MKFAFTGARLSVLSLACASAFSAYGQAESKGTLGEVVVTASRYDQALQSSPVSSSIISAAQIKASGASDANEAIRKVLGIPFRTDLYGGRNYTLDLRGYGPTADQNLVVVVDGLRISENDYGTARLSAIDADSIESIEVVHGASSVQWGEGAIAGLINIVLKKSTQQGVSGSGAVELSSFGGNDVRANVRVGGEHINVDATARSATSKGYRDNNTYRQDTATIGVSGAEDTFKWHARLSGENQGSRFPGPLTFDQFHSDSRLANTPNDFGNYQETRVATGAEYRIRNWLFGLDVGGRVKDSDGYFKGPPVYSSTNKSNGLQVSPRVGYSVNIGASALFVLAGVDYQTWDYKATNNFGQNESAKQNNEAGYVTADLLLPTGTRIITGLRSESVTKSASDSANAIDYTRPNALDAWDLGINQEIGAGLNLYARAAQAYRVSNVDDNRYLTTALEPQTSRDLEMGIKWNHGETGSGALRLFQQDTTNEIAYDPTLGSNTNLDPTRRIGIEVEGNMALASNLRLSGSVQKLQAHYSAGPNDGKEFPLVSSVSAAVRLSWQLDVRQSVDVGLQHLGNARFGDDNANTCAVMIPASTTLDARYAWKQAAWEWSVQGSNLTDQSSYSNAFSCTKGNLYPDNGRSLKLGMKYKF